MSIGNKLKLEMDEATARMVLAQVEHQLGEKRQVYDALTTDIAGLEITRNTLRDQLNNNGSDSSRQPRGDNRARIKEYLSKIPNNKGARASEITKETGIGTSSTAFTLRHYEEFVRDDESKRLKLKNAPTVQQGQ